MHDETHSRELSLQLMEILSYEGPRWLSKESMQGAVGHTAQQRSSRVTSRPAWTGSRGSCVRMPLEQRLHLQHMLQPCQRYLRNSIQEQQCQWRLRRQNRSHVRRPVGV